MKSNYNVNPIFEFSKCSLEFGWNIKFKKTGKTLCTIYPRESYFTAMLVIGPKQKNILRGPLVWAARKRRI